METGLLENMRYVLGPVNGKESSRWLVSEERERLRDEQEPRGNLDEQKDSHDEIEDKADYLKNALA